MAVLDDIKSSKGYVLGVIAFATTVGTFLIQVLHFRPEPTLTAVASLAVFVLFLSWLIDRSEKRSEKRLKEHETAMNQKIDGYDSKLDKIYDMSLENQRSSIRIEMNSYIRNDPNNHDTILAYAEKYFVELNGDWKETDIFFGWIEAEDEAGRTVHIPPQFRDAVYYKRELERKQ